LQYSSDWSQDEFEILIQHFFITYIDCKQTDYSIGADRAMVRFNWQQYNFNLNLECYSQTAWIEADDELSTDNLSTLYHYLQGS